MKFKHPKDGSYRIRSKFLLLPKRIGNETRWLEGAMWIQKISDNYWYDRYWIPSVKFQWSFFELYPCNSKNLEAVIKIKRTAGTKFGPHHLLFEGTVLFTSPSPNPLTTTTVKCGHINPGSFSGIINFQEYNWKPVNIKNLPPYVNLVATAEGEKLLRSL